MTEELLRQLLASAVSTLFVSTRELCSNCRNPYDDIVWENELDDEEEIEKEDEDEIEESESCAMFHDPGKVN